MLLSIKQLYKRGKSYEFSSAWSSPTEKRDRISMCAFAGHGDFAGAVLASVQKHHEADKVACVCAGARVCMCTVNSDHQGGYTIEAEYRLSGQAPRDRSNYFLNTIKLLYLG